jgi:PIN domain nuclease of toxin-antitoxin system
MATKYVLDTHALIWHLEGNSSLGQEAKRIINDPESDMVLPVIALAEAMFIVEKGRSAIPSVADLLADVFNDKRIEIYPLTVGILEESHLLTAVPEIHDRLIVATGVYLRKLGEAIEIVTKDDEITASAILPACWS